MGDEIKRDFAAHEQRLRLTIVTPQHGAHAGKELTQLERLDDVIVRAEVEPGNPIIEVVVSRDDQDRHQCARGSRRLENFDPRHLRQTDVEENEGMFCTCERRAPLGPVAHPIDSHALIAKAAKERLANHWIVFNQQNTH
jgi:hypothetical protein